MKKGACHNQANISTMSFRCNQWLLPSNSLDLQVHWYIYGYGISYDVKVICRVMEHNIWRNIPGLSGHVNWSMLRPAGKFSSQFFFALEGTPTYVKINISKTPRIFMFGRQQAWATNGIISLEFYLLHHSVFLIL